MWAFILAAVASKVYTDTMSWTMDKKYDQGYTEEDLYALQVWEWIGEDLEQLTTTFAHWLFAISYFETALLFPVLFDARRNEDTVKGTKRVARIVLVSQIFFYIS